MGSGPVRRGNGVPVQLTHMTRHLGDFVVRLRPLAVALLDRQAGVALRVSPIRRASAPALSVIRGVGTPARL